MAYFNLIKKKIYNAPKFTGSLTTLQLHTYLWRVIKLVNKYKNKSKSVSFIIKMLITRFI